MLDTLAGFIGFSAIHNANLLCCPTLE